MKLNTTPIVGEHFIQSADSQHNALEQFYRAFNTRDYALMKQNWSNGPEISMCNPLGGLLRGWDEIRGLYQRIFSGPANVYVEFYDYSLQDFDQGFLALGRERAQVHIEGRDLTLGIRTSRLFRWEPDGWRQWHHHGSVEDPDALARYRQLLTDTSLPRDRE